eukprot:gene13252-37067_t
MPAWWAAREEPLCSVDFVDGLRIEDQHDVTAIVDFANADLHVGD